MLSLTQSPLNNHLPRNSHSMRHNIPTKAFVLLLQLPDFQFIIILNLRMRPLKRKRQHQFLGVTIQPRDNIRNSLSCCRDVEIDLSLR